MSITKKLYSFALRTVPRPILIKASLVVRKVTARLNKGDAVECPICGSTYSHFLPFGRVVRNNVLCPNCLSLERHRLMWLYLNRETKFFEAQLKVLHVAPEQCFYKRLKALPNLDYTTADLVSPLADMKFDIQKIPLADNSFDVVICNHVLEHVDDDRLAMREFYRILKPGGFAILMVPIDYERDSTLENPEYNTPQLREKHYWQNDHQRLYGTDFNQRIGEIGFMPSTDNYTAQLPENEIQRYRLVAQELMYAYRKP